MTEEERCLYYVEYGQSKVFCVTLKTYINPIECEDCPINQERLPDATGKEASDD